MTDWSSVPTELEGAWQDVRSDPSFSTSTCEIAGLTLRIEGVGTIPSKLREALSHHSASDRPSSDRTPDLTIRVWDLGLGGRRPQLPGAAFHHDGMQNLSNDGGQLRVRYDWTMGVLMVWDSGTGVAWWCAERDSDITWWEQAAPFRPVLAWWLSSTGRIFAHSAAVAVGERAVLLVGAGGSGKSTTALRCHRSGLGVLGDDYCVVARAERQIRSSSESRYHVASLYRTIKLRPVDDLFPQPQIAHNEEGRKVVLSLDASSGGPLLANADLACVMSVSVGEGERTAFEWGHAGAVLRSMSITTIQQLPGVGPVSLQMFGEIVRAVPTGTLLLGSDRKGVVEAVRELIGASGSVASDAGGQP